MELLEVVLLVQVHTVWQ